MERTVQQVADELGPELAIKWADHRAECLESEIRRLRQSLRSMSDGVIAGDSRTVALARQVLDLLDSER